MSAWETMLSPYQYCLVVNRASDKRKNMAAQKAAAQRRLLQPRGGLIDSDERKKTGQGRRKEELVRW